MRPERKMRIPVTGRILLLVMVMAVFAGVKQTWAAPEETEMSFVLVTDVSRTMSKSDTRGYSKDAISMFLDMLPAEKTAAGILTFGHNNAKNAYPYQEEFLPVTREHPDFVHELSAPVPLETGREKLKSQVREIVWNGEQTLIEAALLAGCDMLTAAGVKDNAGCVILITDGDYKSRYIADEKNVTDDLARAVEALNRSGWYAYCIELDYANDPANRETAHRFLTENITDRCNGETYEVEDAGDIGTAFLEILNSLYGTGAMESGVTNADGYAIREFEIGDLTSEANITVIGNGILGVELLRDGETAATVGRFSADTDETSYDKNLYEVGLGKIYCNIKRILPEQGNWILRVRADAESRVVTNAVTYSDLTVETSVMPADTAPERPLTKADSIEAKLSIRYHGQNVGRESLGGAKASVRFSNLTTGEELSSRTMEWKEESSSYEAVIPVAGLGRAGKLTAVCELRFGDGEIREGEEVMLYTHNDPLILKDGSPLDLEGRVRTRLEPVDLRDRYQNPDSDEVRIKAAFPEETGIGAELSADGTEVTLFTGERAGAFMGELLLWDADMGEEGALRIPLSLTVHNSPMQMKPIGKIDMVAAHTLETQLDLNEYFTDEDQPEIVFVLEEGYDPEILEITAERNILKIRALSDGSTAVTVRAADDDGTEFRNAFTVTGATESSIRRRKIREFWGKTSLLAVLFGVLAFAALLAVLFVRENTKLRGIWKIVISAPGKKDYSYELNTAADVSGKDRKKADLCRVLDLRELPAEQPSAAVLLEHAGPLNDVILTGLFREEGCRIRARRGVRMLVNGRETAKAKLGHKDEAVILIPGGDGETAVTVRIIV